MNILFFCRTNKTKMMVQIAERLKEKSHLGSAYAFVAYYDKWRKYLKEQKTVEFEKIFGTKEIYKRMAEEETDPSEIRRIEKEYGSLDMELWNVIFSESLIVKHTHYKKFNSPAFSKDDMLRYIQAAFREVEKFFSENKIDAVIDFAPVNLLRSVIDMVAKKNNIPYIYPFQALIKDRWIINARFREDYKELKKYYFDLLDDDKSDLSDGYSFLEWYREKSEESVYSQHMLKDQPGPIKRIIKSIRTLLSGVKNSLYEIKLRIQALTNSDIRYNFQLYKNLPSINLKRWIFKSVQKIRSLLRNPFYKGEPPEEYIFLTLHIQPEASTSVLSPFFVNQAAVIDSISRALPLNMNLVIKPHKLMKGIEPVDFYRKINSIPNVYLLDYNADTIKLIENSKAVITITGTSGFEAVLKGKKVIAMSRYPVWAMIKDIDICTDFTKLHDLLSKIESFSTDDRSLAAYIQAIYDNSFPLKENYIWREKYDISDEGYKEAIYTISDRIAMFLKSNTN